MRWNTGVGSNVKIFNHVVSLEFEVPGVLFESNDSKYKVDFSLSLCGSLKLHKNTLLHQNATVKQKSCFESKKCQSSKCPTHCVLHISCFPHFNKLLYLTSQSSQSVAPEGKPCSQSALFQLAEVMCSTVCPRCIYTYPGFTS